MERDAVARLGIKGPRTIVEPFGLDAGEFADLPARGTFRSTRGLGERPLVAFLGRLDYGKGLELLIPAFEKSAPADAALVVIGPDSHSGYRAAVERMIDAHALRERVVLTGMLGGRDKLAALVDADLLAQPSFHENFGMAVLEGLACGCPVLISDQVYLHPRISAAGVGGVTACTVEAVTAELGRWMADEGMRRTAAGRARAFALGEFAWDRVAADWVEHYRGFVSASPRGGD
jgi:glycosyltransferase involved in cell wall biosynthesis